MFSSKALAVFLILCATVSAAPVERRSIDDGLETLVARGPTGHNSGTNQHPHPQNHPAPPHQPHASTSSHPIPIPHNNHPSAHGNHSPSSSQYGTPSQSPTHSHHGSPQGGHSPVSSSGSFHSAHSPPHSPVSSSGSFHSAHGSPPPHPGQHMIDAVHKSGAKISAQDVVHIWPLGRQIPGVHPGTQHAWLETGNDRSGMQHIVNKHGPAFAQQGIPHDQLPHLAEQATRHGDIMGTQGRSRTIYRTEHQGSTHHVAVETANNGYVVSMNPSSEASARKAAKKWKGLAQQNQPGPSSGNPGSSSGTGN